MTHKSLKAHSFINKHLFTLTHSTVLDKKVYTIRSHGFGATQDRKYKTIYLKQRKRIISKEAEPSWSRIVSATSGEEEAVYMSHYELLYSPTHQLQTLMSGVRGGGEFLSRI